MARCIWNSIVAICRKINHKSNAPKIPHKFQEIHKVKYCRHLTQLAGGACTTGEGGGGLPCLVIHQMRFQLPATIISSILFLNQINVLLLDLFVLFLMCFYYANKGRSRERERGRKGGGEGKHACQCSRSFYGSQAEP